MAAKVVVSPASGNFFMLCNEAIVRGALEAGVRVYAAYPGSPTTEILDTFYELRDEIPAKVNISTNEKVALETAAGAAMAGLRSLTSMKSVGLNVASDSFFSLSYTGVKGGMVIAVADDPHAHSSQSEQDGRLYALASYMPMLEPSNPQEALEMIKDAFALSEKFGVPVILRTVTRVNHQSGIVKTNEMKMEPFEKVPWPHEPVRFVTVADFARKFKKNMLERTQKIQAEFEKSSLNRIENADSKSDTGIITASAGYNYSVEAYQILGISPKILKLGTTYPLPEKLICDFIKGLQQVVIVEELSPYLENAVLAVAKACNPGIRVIGKRTGDFSQSLEYNPNIVATVFSRVFGAKVPVDYQSVLDRAARLKEHLPIRPPTFCPGCPHRGTIHAVRLALKNKKHVLATDIGCYSMSPLPPNNYGDTLLSMGASLGVAQGLQYAVKEPVVAMIGDSTFYHAGLPGVVNAVHQKANFKLFILDNEVTAMTGQQPHPGTHETVDTPVYERMVIEDVLRGFGVKDILIIDAYDVRNNVAKIRQFIGSPGFGVIISRRPCALYGDRQKRRRGEKITPNKNDKTVCRKIYACVKDFYCPAITVDGDGQAQISQELCDGCMECARLCPVSAIKPREG